MSQLGVASADNPPEGSTDPLHFSTLGEPQDRHGPCNAWDYMGGDSEVWRMFGHENADKRAFIEILEKTLPVVESPTSIRVGWTGYWDKVGEITVPQYCQTTDEVGRGMFFIGDNVIMQRYLKGDTLIYYSRTNGWSNQMVRDEHMQVWLSELSTCKN